MMRHPAACRARMDHVPAAVVVAASHVRQALGQAQRTADGRGTRGMRAQERLQPACVRDAIRVQEDDRVATAFRGTAVASAGCITPFARWPHRHHARARRTRLLGGCVGRTVVHHQDLDLACSGALAPHRVHDLGDVPCFVARGNDHGNQRPRDRRISACRPRIRNPSSWGSRYHRTRVRTRTPPGDRTVRRRHRARSAAGPAPPASPRDRHPRVLDRCPPPSIDPQPRPAPRSRGPARTGVP